MNEKQVWALAVDRARHSCVPGIQCSWMARPGQGLCVCGEEHVNGSLLPSLIDLWRRGAAGPGLFLGAGWPEGRAWDGKGGWERAAL